MSIDALLDRISNAILNPFIILLFAASTAVFIWGVVKFIAGAADDKVREEGKKNILWGVVGMFIMMSVFGIINVLLGTFDIPYP